MNKAKIPRYGDNPKARVWSRILIKTVLFVCLSFLYPSGGYCMPTNSTSDIKIVWVEKNKLQFRVQVEDGTAHIEFFKLKVNGDELFYISNGKIGETTSLTYINIEDIGGAGWDGYYSTGLGTITFTGKDFDGSNEWFYVDWIPNFTESKVLDITVRANVSNGGEENDYGWEPWAGGDKYFIKDIPEPEEFKVSFNADRKGVLSWKTPTEISSIISKNTDATVTVEIRRDNTAIKSLPYTSTSYTDTEKGDSYEAYYKVVLSNSYGLNTTLESAKAGGDAPEIREVNAPAGLSASIDGCGGKIIVSWDYNGELEPSEFVLKSGGSTLATLAGDVREYVDNVGDHTSKSYTITAKGSYSGVSSERTSSVTATGTTSGLPVKAGGFGVSRSGNDARLYWSSASHHNKYIIKRSSSSGSAEFEISDTDQTSYTDNGINGCETYTYELFAANECTDDLGISGVKSTNSPTIRIQPYLSSYITSFDASKAYFPDKVLLEWTVQSDNLSLVDNFEISRRKAGESAYTIIATVQGQSSYEDKTASGGYLYEYKIVAGLRCEDDKLTSNSRTAVGFRIPYGMVSGNIDYENGVNVKGVEVLAEKSAAAIGNSLSFPGDRYVTVSDDSKLKPSEYITVEAWVKPQNSWSNAEIFHKQSGATGYSLHQMGDDVRFVVNVGGTAREVMAENVLTANEYVHVAGVKDSTGVKIYINGEIPYTTSYTIGQEDTTYLKLLGVDTEIVGLLGELVGRKYTSFVPLQNDLTEAVDTGQAQRLIPLLVSVITDNELIPGTFQNVTGNISHTNSELRIGMGFYGNIDEIRIWNTARDAERVNYDYKRIVGNDAEGIAAYWRCDENFGDKIYDVSKSGGEFHKNDGSLNGVSWSSDIPSKYQLGWMGKTSENGSYIIPYIPYIGTGENFTLTPRYEQHQFDPASKTIFIGEGAAIAEGQDFTDISSFKVTGKVFYEDTYCGVEGAMIGVDGQPVIKDGSPVYTDPFGKFEIAVPVGQHYVYVEKNGHVFNSFKFPPGPVSATFDFQEPINGINFIDETKVTVTGRVVGGTREGDKDPGLGLSKNNIGIAEFTLQSALGCTSYPVRTDSITGEYTLDVPPMVYLVEDFQVPKNPVVTDYFNEFPEANFSLVTSPNLVTHTYSGTVEAIITINTSERKGTMRLQGKEELISLDTVYFTGTGPKYQIRFYYDGDAYEYIIDGDREIVTIEDEYAGDNTIDSAYYHYRYDLIFRTPPQVRIAGADSVSDFTGDEVIKYEDPVSNTMKRMNVVDNPFNYPFFTQNKQYSLTIHAEEYYVNQDICEGINGCDEAVLDRVPVNDGRVVINNQLAQVVSPEPLNLTNGTSLYTFKAGQPQVLADANFPWRDFSGAFTITVNIDGVGYEWLPFKHKDSLAFSYPLASLHPDDKYYRGYVLGNNPIEGSDFVTDGPQMVDMILRDPPGNGSYSFLEKGSTFSYEESMSFSHGESTTFNTHISLGPKFEVTAFGASPEVETIIQGDLGFSQTSSKNEEGSLSHEVTTTDYWQTSEDPYLPGAPSDLFFGSSKNYVISLADNLSIFPAGFADENGIKTGGSEVSVSGKGYKVGLNKSLLMAPDGSPTSFIYTADHIQNMLIPNLINVRNNLFVTNPAYKSNISIDNELYGTNNDDPRWGESVTSDNPLTAVPADYSGSSYTFTPANEGDADQVRKLNQQIRLWEEALERNEMEKYYAETKQNISYDAGPVYQNSVETSVSQSHSSSFELSVTDDFAFAVGAYFAGAGAEVQTSFNFERSVGKTTTNTQTQTNTFGYVLYDEDEGDYFSVDVKDPGTGTGPVFALKAGRSMCPCETSTSMDYFVPAKYMISDSIIGILRSLEAEESFLKLLSRSEKTKKYTFSDIASVFPVPEVVKKVIPGDAEFMVPQIKDREFRKRYELTEAFYDIVNLNLDPSLSEYSQGVNNNLGAMSDDDLRDFGAFMKTTLEGGNRIYLFAPETREQWEEEFVRYRSYIYDMSAKVIKSPESLDASTLRREYPVASITPAIRQNIPDDNKAYLTMQIGNLSETDEAQIYEAKIVEASNPDGAIIKIDGSQVQRGYVVEAGEYINKTITVEMGKPDVYEYNDLMIIVYSACERQLVGNITGAIPEEAIDTVVFSVHFVPSCTNIDISRPKNQFIINSEDEHLVEGVRETKVPILMTGYDMNNTMFEKLNFQFKSAANPDWILTEDFYMVAPDENKEEIPGNFTAVEWDLSGYPDGEYNLRAKTYCGTTPEGTEIFDLSEVWSGVVDRKPPLVFGTPQPADGILSPDDDIIIEFNESIYGGKLNYLANFDIRGILNGTDLRHDVSVAFDDNTNDFVRIPEGINLVAKSFTIEFWMRTRRGYQRECIFSQNTDPDNAVRIMLNQEGEVEFQIGDQLYTEDKINTASILDEWHHWAFVYDDIRKEAIVLLDGVPLGSGSVQPLYTGYGDAYLGKSMIADNYPFEGNLHELRIWERPRTASGITANMLITLSGKETGLIGYWPFDDADGTLAAEKVHRRNATVSAPWDIDPKGYAASFAGNEQGYLDMNFSDIAFGEEEDFSIEFWFKAEQGSNICFLSNGHGDGNDLIMYYYSLEDLYMTANVLPLEDDLQDLLSPMLNKLFSDEAAFLNEIASYLGEEKTEKYTEQLLRFGKHMPTYWSINTDAQGNIQVNNNGKRIKTEGEDYFDNRWHHLALVVQRVGNTRLYIDSELKVSEPSTEWNGFGAARLFLGARGLYNQDIAGYDFDQFFAGSLDELRIWNTAVKQSQIERNRTMRLDGDELGLVAYFPCESYEEVMGVPVIGGLYGDLITHDSVRNVQGGMGVLVQSNDVPNVRMKRPSSQVDFSFVAQEDRIAFVLNEPNAKIENCILDITTRNVEDMHGNKMSSPVTWSAYIDRNQVKWADQNFNLEKEIYAPMSITTRIVNYSGQQQFFTLEGLPGWATAEPREGTLEPLSEQVVEITISEGVNVGTYSKDISLKTDFGFDEKLQVSLRVYEPLPEDWKISPEDYEFSMNIIGYATVNGVISADPYDKVAAFVDGECRGIANLTYIEDYDMYQVFLDVYSNKAYAEYFELHLWDAGSGREFRGIRADGLEEAPEEYANHYEFMDNNIYGSPGNPIALVAEELTISKLPLNAGWNWMSFNLDMDRGKTMNQLLEGYDFRKKDMIKGLTRYTEYHDVWIGSLNFLEPEEMYMFRVDQQDTLKVTGIPVDPNNTPVPVVRGWNWIGYTPSVNIGINDALGLFTPNNGDLIKSQYAFAMYDPFMGWVGTLQYLRPGYGYKYRYVEAEGSAMQQDLYFPRTGSRLKSGTEDESDLLPGIDNWSDFSGNMSVVAIVEGLDKQSTKDKLYAYAGNELRGSVEPVKTAEDRYICFLTVYGGDKREALNFMYETEAGDVYRLKESLSLVNDSIAGEIVEPFVFSISGKTTGGAGDIQLPELSFYPNPFSDWLNIEFIKEADEEVEIALLDISGKLVRILKAESGESVVKKQINTRDLKEGSYLLRFKINERMKYNKIIKIN